MIGVGANITGSIKTIFDIPSSSMVTVLDKNSTIMHGPIFRDIDLLYDSVANLPAAEDLIGAQSTYTSGPK